MSNTGQTKRSQEFEKLWVKYSGFIRNPPNVLFKRFGFGTRIGYAKKHKLLINVLTNINWLKRAIASDPIFLTLALMMGSLQL